MGALPEPLRRAGLPETNLNTGGPDEIGPNQGRNMR